MPDQPRPPVVTLACLFLGVTSGMLLIEIYGVLSDWGSLELQRVIRDALSESGIRGLTVDRTLGLVQVGAYLAIPLCVAGIVLSFFTFRGDRGSRIGLTILCAIAAVAFLGTGFTGAIAGLLAVTCAFVLWSPEARAWFRGSPPPPRAAPALGTAGPPAHLPRPEYGGRAPLPREVLIGCVVALIGSLLSAAFCGGFALLMLLRRVMPKEFEKAYGGDPFGGTIAFGITSTPAHDALAIAIGTALAVLALSAAGLSAALLFGARWARRPLLVCATASVLLSAVAFPAGLVIVVAAVICIRLLNSQAARRW